MIFKSAQAGRISEDIALQIESAILSGQQKRGCRLSSERWLLEIFKTSRGVF
ncbi:hypothetical protein QUF76_04960 [Desulfobacterales bacterium HSG16]|nr:hypothetical protein [Desulfobacterales bacterium HSG16]